MSIVLHARLLCTRRLLENRGTMAGVWLFQAVLRAVLLAGLCVSVWMLSTLHRHAAPLSAGARAALYALFAAAAAVKGILLFRLRRALAQRKNSVYASSVPPDPFEFGG